MSRIKHSTVLMACQTTEDFVNLLMMLSDTENKSMHSLLEPYNELIWKQDDSPSVAILIRHDLEDGTESHAIGMTFKGVDYLIHDHDVSKDRSVDKLKSWFPTLNPILRK